MALKYLICMLALALTHFAPVVSGQGAAKATNNNADADANAVREPLKQTQMSEAERARFDELRKRGFEALYNLDYEEARRNFKELARVFPDHPAGPQFLAASLWAQTLNESRRLQSGLYNSDSFYAKNEDQVDPRTIAQFREWTRNAKQLAEARLKRDQKDTEALYFLGATEGLKAAFATAVQRSFFGALKDGSNSVDRHREVIRLDPNFHDAELTIGLYDYVIGSLPLPVKLVMNVAGARGSKKRGLQTLERVAREGRFAQDDARALLILLYKREGRFQDALAVARELVAKYPRSYLLKLEAADALMSQAAVEQKASRPAESANAQREALTIFNDLLRSTTARDTASRALDLIHFRYAEALLVNGQKEQAAKEFLSAANIQGAEQGLATMAHLRAAQSLDLAGKRNEAISQYRVVLARPNVYDSQDEARQGLREPYEIKDQEKSVKE
jgi:tetratricopeptide (TPR) repeat protein